MSSRSSGSTRRTFEWERGTFSRVFIKLFYTLKLYIGTRSNHCSVKEAPICNCLVYLCLREMPRVSPDERRAVQAKRRQQLAASNTHTAAVDMRRCLFFLACLLIGLHCVYSLLQETAASSHQKERFERSRKAQDKGFQFTDPRKGRAAMPDGVIIPYPSTKGWLRLLQRSVPFMFTPENTTSSDGGLFGQVIVREGLVSSVVSTMAVVLVTVIKKTKF